MVELCLAVVDAGGDGIKIREDRFHPSRVIRSLVWRRVAHAQNLLHASKLGSKLGNSRLGHAVVAEQEDGRQHGVVARLVRIVELLVEEMNSQVTVLVFFCKGQIVRLGLILLRDKSLGRVLAMLAQAELSLHPQVAGREGTDGML